MKISLKSQDFIIWIKKAILLLDFCIIVCMQELRDITDTFKRIDFKVCDSSLQQWVCVVLTCMFCRYSEVNGE